jgi:hypothetical protein
MKLKPFLGKNLKGRSKWRQKKNKLFMPQISILAHLYLENFHIHLLQILFQMLMATEAG